MIVPQMEPNFGKEEAVAVFEYMSQEPAPWLTEYKKTEELEKLIADFVGTKHCVMVTNGTVSLIAALQAMNIGQGDIVIVPNYTMFATATAASILGCQVEFVDVERNSLCISYKSLVDKVEDLCLDEGRRVACVILVSINGRYPTEFENIMEYCHDCGIPVIEDAAQSLGSFYKGKHVGTFGEIGSFSFSTPKIISTAQGGCLVTNDKELDKKIRMIKNFGRSDPTADDFEIMGWNFKFTDIQAVVGIEQMKKLPKHITIKKDNYKMYRECLENNSGIEFISTNLKTTTPWMNDVLLTGREEIIVGLKRKGIGSRPFYPAMNTRTPYMDVKGDFPISHYVASNGLWLPSSTKLTFEEIEYVCNTLKALNKDVN